MKNLFKVFLLAISLVTFNYVLTSCDKDDTDEYYAGESEEDYKPNYYTVESSWDLSAVSGLTEAQKKEVAKELAESISGTKKFDTRQAAVYAFDESVEALRQATDIPAGLKGTITLKRGTAIIKRATLKW